MKTRRRLSWLMLFIMVVGLVLTACGGGEEATDTPEPAAPEATEPPPPTEAPPTEAPPPEPVEVEPVKIGELHPFTGPLSEFGEPEHNAALLAAKQLEEAGYAIETVFADTETSAIPAVEAARRLVEIEGVHVLIGGAASGVTVPIAEAVSIPDQVPQISYASTSPLITALPSDEGQDFLFRTCPSDALQGVVLGKLLYDEGLRDVSVLYVNNPYGQGLNDVFKATFESLGGNVVASVPHDEEAAASYTAELRQATEGDPEALIALSYTGHASVYLKEAIEGDFISNFRFVDGTKSATDIPEAVGADALEGMCGTAPGAAETDSLATFNATYEEEYGEVPPLPFMTNTYDAVIVAALAAYEAQIAGEELSSIAVRDHLRSVAGPPGEKVFAGVEGLARALELLSQGEEIDYVGAAGEVDFDENGDVVTPVEVWCYEGGTPVTKRLEEPGKPPPVAAEEDLLDEIMAAGKLVVSTDPNYAPQSFLNEAGDLDGFDINVSQEVAERMGVELEFEMPDWDTITPGGWAARWDLSIGSMTPTEARSEVLWFTIPYYYTPASFAVHKDNTDIASVEDLAGKSVGLGAATTYLDWFEGNLAMLGGEVVYDPPAGVDIVEHTTDLEAIQDLILGDGVRLDAVMTAQPTIQNAIDEGLPLKYVGTPAFYEPLVFALDKARGPSDKMVAKLNEILAEMHADGTLSELSEEWYGVDITQIVAPEEAEAPPAEVGEETLIFAQSADAGTLDPALETSANSLAPASHIYEGLTAFEPGTTTPIPGLATSWEASDDGLEWTFNLREGVTFHDGTPFNADAVVFNFERWWDTDNPYNLGADQFIYWDYMFQGFKGDENSVLAGIEKIDDYTVKLILNVPNASLLNTLTMENFRFASPAAVEEQGDTYGTAEGLAVGTGPFKVEEWLKEDHLTLLRNDDYWGELPTLQRIEYRVIPDTSAAFLALQAGEIDALSLWASPGPDDIATALDDPELQVIYNPAFNVGYLGLNHAKEWLQNENVRLAIAHAIDKQAIVDSLYPGDAETASQFQPRSLWGYNDAIEDYPYDPALAQEYLQAAIDEGVEIPDPAIFYVMPVSRAYYPQPQPTGELIQAFLAEIGINTEIQSPAWPDPYLSDLEEDGTKHDLFMLGWVGDNGDPDNFLCTFFCGGDTTFNNDGAGGGLPPDEEIAQLLRDAVAEVDFETRKAMYEEANQLLHDRVISVPVVQRTPPTLFRSNISGYVPSPVREMLTYLVKE